MKSTRLSRWLGGSHGLLLILYTLFVLFTASVLRVQDAQYLPKWLLLLACLCCVLCPWLLRRTGRLRIAVPAAEESAPAWKWRFLFFAVPFLCFLVKYIVYYPGGFTSDSIVQYEQVLTGQYDNWHPAIHTLLFFALPLFLTGGWAGSIVLFQILLFSLALSCAFSTLRRVAGNRFACFSLAFVLLNPETANLAVSPWKDVAFGIGALLLVSMVLRIRFFPEERSVGFLRLLFIGIVLALTVLMRHNAVLFVAPLLLALGFLLPRKRFAALLCCFAVVFCGIRFPLYSALHVSSPGERAVETLGLPMTIIGACAKHAPETLDAETAEFITRVAPREVWDTCDDYRDFNTVKWHPLTDLTVVGEYGAPRILSMAARCFVHAPMVSFRSLIRLTDVVYTLTDDYNYCDYPKDRLNSYGLEIRGFPALQEIWNRASGAVNLTFPWLFMYAGAMHFVLLVLLLAKCRFRRKKDRPKILAVLPVFVYNWGTALLLTGASDGSRFFAYTFWVMPFLAALLLREEPKEYS